MARAETIWIVIQPFAPKAAFTVKHELETWLSKRDEDTIAPLKVWRIPDGGYGEAQEVPLDKLAIDKPSAWSARRGWDD